MNERPRFFLTGERSDRNVFRELLARVAVEPRTNEEVPVVRTLEPGHYVAQAVVDAFVECLRRWGARARGFHVADSDTGVYVYESPRTLQSQRYRDRLRADVGDARVVVLPVVYGRHWILWTLVLNRHREGAPVDALYANSDGSDGPPALPAAVAEFVEILVGHRRVAVVNAKSTKQDIADCALHAMQNMEYFCCPPAGAGADAPDLARPADVSIRRAVANLRRRRNLPPVQDYRGPLQRFLQALADAPDPDALLRRRRGFLLQPIVH